MEDPWTGKMTPGKALHARPRPAVATSLTAASKHLEPRSSDFADEALDAVNVAGDGMIIQPALHHLP